MPSPDREPAEPASRAAPESSSFSDPLLRNAVIGIFILMLVGALYFAKSFLMPVAVAFLLALIFAPVVRSLRRRHVPEVITALALVVLLLGAIVGGGYWLSNPVSEWMADAPSIARQVQRKIAPMQQPVEKAADQVKELTQEKTDVGVQRVVISEPGLLSQAATSTPNIVSKIGLTLTLLLFLLASGDMFYEKLVKSLPTFSDKKHGVRVAHAVERELSRYFFAVTVINIALGVVVGAAMYVIGVPNPALWGIAAALLNFIPYVGPLIGIVTIGLVAFVSLDTLEYALLAPGAYLLCNILEGGIITPLAVGRRLEINTVAIFIAIAFWGWLWGFVGVFLAVPILVVLKVMADNSKRFRPLGQFLAARESASINVSNGEQVAEKAR